MADGQALGRKVMCLFLNLTISELFRHLDLNVSEAMGVGMRLCTTLFSCTIFMRWAGGRLDGGQHAKSTTTKINQRMILKEEGKGGPDQLLQQNHGSSMQRANDQAYVFFLCIYRSLFLG